MGYGGSCFQKDVLDLVYLAETYGVPEVAEYWKWVVRMNDYQKERFARRVIHDMFDTVAGKHLAMFGYAFKKDTGDTRETAAAYVSKILLEEQAHIVAYDPKTTETSMYMELDYTCGVNEATCPQLKKDMLMVKDPYEAAKGAHAILVMTEWDMFRDLDYERVYDEMEKPAIVFDGRGYSLIRPFQSPRFSKTPIRMATTRCVVFNKSIREGRTRDMRELRMTRGII